MPGPLRYGGLADLPFLGGLGTAGMVWSAGFAGRFMLHVCGEGWHGRLPRDGTAADSHS